MFKPIFLSSLFLWLLSVVACQTEIDTETGTNLNTNNTTSETSRIVKRMAMFDGSYDDFLDNAPCFAIKLPVVVTVNDTVYTLKTPLDYNKVKENIAQFTDDSDAVIFEFPITVILENYSTYKINNQAEFNVLNTRCNNSIKNNEDPVNTVNLQYPFTILTYNANLVQNGSVVIESKIGLYSFISTFSNVELYAINYPLFATVKTISNNENEINSDLNLKTNFNESLVYRSIRIEAKNNIKKIEALLLKNEYQIQSLVINNVDMTKAYNNYGILFANNLKALAMQVSGSGTTSISGTYTASSDLDLFLTLNFEQGTELSVINKTWIVTEITDSSISMKNGENNKLIITKK